MLLRVWDFAGQHVTHGIHEGFLDSRGRTACLLVLDPTQSLEHDEAVTDEERDGNRLTYWLKNIAHFAGTDVPVVVAVSKAEEMERQQPGGGRRPIERELENGVSLGEHVLAIAKAVGFIDGKVRVVDDLDARQPIPKTEPAADDPDPDPVTKLRRALEDALRGLDGIRDKVHPALPDLLQKVEEEVAKASLVPISTYREWCEAITYTDAHGEEVNLTQVGQQDDLLGQLHRFGSLFYLGYEPVPAEAVGSERIGDRDLTPGQRRLLNRPSSELLMLYAINPVWLTRPLYKVIKRAGAVGSRGLMGRVEMRQIVDDPGEPLAAGIVHDVIDRLEMAYYVDRLAKYLFPIGLEPVGEMMVPDWARDREPCWRGTMTWPFLPEAAFYRLVVRLYERTVSNKRWRMGLVIGSTTEGGDLEAMVEADPGAGQVTITLKPASSDRADWARGAESMYRTVREALVDLVGDEPAEEWPEFAEADGGGAEARLEDAQQLEIEEKRLGVEWEETAVSPLPPKSIVSEPPTLIHKDTKVVAYGEKRLEMKEGFPYKLLCCLEQKIGKKYSYDEITECVEDWGSYTRKKTIHNTKANLMKLLKPIFGTTIEIVGEAGHYSLKLHSDPCDTTQDE